MFPCDVQPRAIVANGDADGAGRFIYSGVYGLVTSFRQFLHLGGASFGAAGHLFLTSIHLKRPVFTSFLKLLRRLHIVGFMGIFHLLRPAVRLQSHQQVICLVTC